MSTVYAADLFCGAGGSSTGLSAACSDAGLGLDLLAVNHWDVAISTHSANHPHAKHLCESLDNVNPRKATKRERLNILIASPECIHHSNARGGKPMSDQSRASAWHVLRWAEALYIDNILIENVREFSDWGPLGVDGRPLKSKRGHTFHAFLKALESLGYRVDYRVLNAADYGDATTRNRLFVQARRNSPIVWPEPTHAPSFATQDLFGTKQAWKPARGIIDWSIPSASIFSRKRPLAAATVERIKAGLQRFGGKSAEPFLVVLRNHCDAQSLDRPAPTITAGGEHLGLCQPFIMPLNHGAGDNRAYSIEQPMQTITSVDAWGLVEPLILKYYGTGEMKGVGEPLPTVTAKDRFGLVEFDGRRLDIRFRMLQPHELAAAMGFPAHYQFAGNREQRVKQIGNAVPVNLARAICAELIRGYARKASAA
jgi:DNA (cytosine-5)-methyltransferase 1